MTTPIQKIQRLFFHHSAATTTSVLTASEAYDIFHISNWANTMFSCRYSCARW